jgi:anti-sigma B factor antagonist
MTDESPISLTRGFRVECSPRKNSTIVSCHGRLTSENAPLLKSEVKNLFPSAKRIVVDLKDVPSMDSAGLGALAALYVSARTRGCPFVLVNANAQIRELLGISNLLLLFEAAGRHGRKTM